jgi:hypothetical protein
MLLIWQQNFSAAEWQSNGLGLMLPSNILSSDPWLTSVLMPIRGSNFPLIGRLRLQQRLVLPRPTISRGLRTLGALHPAEAGKASRRVMLVSPMIPLLVWIVAHNPPSEWMGRCCSWAGKTIGRFGGIPPLAAPYGGGSEMEPYPSSDWDFLSRKLR